MNDKAFFMKNTILILVTFLVSVFALNAQDHFVKDSSKWIVGLNSKYLNYNNTLKLGDQQYTFGATQQSIGLRVGYKGLVLVVGVAGFPLAENESKPQSTLNCVLRFYPKNMYFKIDGSYLSSRSGLSDYLTDFNRTYSNDGMVWNIDAQGLYMFNKNKINLQSFFAFRNQQLISAGSWTANAYVKTTLIKAHECAIEGLVFVDPVSINMFFNRIGLGGGYIYSLKLAENLHWASMLSLSVEVITSDLFGVNDAPIEYDFVLNLRPHAFSSLVYNHNRYYTGLQFEYFPAVASSLSNQYQLEFYSLRLSAGYRW
jgi:hypothetical protein